MDKSLIDQLHDFKLISQKLIKEKKEESLKRSQGCRCHKCTSCRWRSLDKLKVTK